MRFTTHIKPVSQQISLLTGLNVGGKTLNIGIQLVLQQCCKTSYTFFVALFYAPLARAKSEALFNIYSFLKENKKSTNTQDKVLCTCSTLFCTIPCRCFALLKPETFFHFLIISFLEKCLRSCSLCFFTAAHFHLGSRWQFKFSDRCYLIFMFFFQWNLSPLSFISRSSFFPVIQDNVGQCRH